MPTPVNVVNPRDHNMFGQRNQGPNFAANPMNVAGADPFQNMQQQMQPQQPMVSPDSNGLLASLQAQQQQRPMANPFRRFRL